ncbi:hypothetical protein IE81DRAFT_366138 [Ceraceosorus guamensis]|uniref:TOM13-domain-containing protein n=1 Tax=Ceraceosorus guamensis TaxID=1522189 RepID=A0A316VZI6_9BASI|nr:hypothetical protein IE81DRAFT_366138 [Ceraceosorus guamensis]PWN42950.1 hypothetical protein IE81DRAFT_366138 [Ceraceosorus guamensis]
MQQQQDGLAPAFVYDPAPESSEGKSERTVDPSLLASPARSTRTNNSSTSSTERGEWSDGDGDDSALDLLVDAHDRSNNSSGISQADHQDGSEEAPITSDLSGENDEEQGAFSDATPVPDSSGAFDALDRAELERNTQHKHRPSHHDASFGLDPDADLNHAISGRPLFGLSPGHHTHHHHQHHSHHEHEGSSRDGGGQPSSAVEGLDRGRTSHSSRSGPFTTPHSSGLPDTVPTASATGMPRILPRRYSRSRSPTGSVHSSNAPPPKEMRVQSPSGDAAGGVQDAGGAQSNVPSGSLTLAAFAPGLKWRRRLALLSATIGINLGLPFLNGVMLGFGEIFARAVLAPMLGLSLGAVGVGSMAHREELERLRGTGRAGNARVGLSGAAGSNAGIGQKDGNTRWAQGAEGVDLDGWALEADDETKKSRRR